MITTEQCGGIEDDNLSSLVVFVVLILIMIGDGLKWCVFSPQIYRERGPSVSVSFKNCTLGLKNTFFMRDKSIKIVGGIIWHWQDICKLIPSAPKEYTW